MFSLIEKDTISPKERAKTLEYHLEEGKRTAFSEGIEEGLEKGVKLEKILRFASPWGRDGKKLATSGDGYSHDLPGDEVNRG